jgi:hypothetical protein
MRKMKITVYCCYSSNTWKWKINEHLLGPSRLKARESSSPSWPHVWCVRSDACVRSKRSVSFRENLGFLFLGRVPLSLFNFVAFLIRIKKLESNWIGLNLVVWPVKWSSNARLKLLKKVKTGDFAIFLHSFGSEKNRKGCEIYEFHPSYEPHFRTRKKIIKDLFLL